MIFGQDEAECKSIYNQVEKAMEEMGKVFEVTCITDPERIVSYGINQTPAVILTEYKLKSEGEVPPVIVIKEWIKEI